MSVRQQSMTGLGAFGAARATGRSRSLRIDTVTVALVLALTLLGLVMVTSASISIASKETGDAFLYLERQLLLIPQHGQFHLSVFTGSNRLTF
jgi:cell division protein FtsW (lipid II flippase)